MRGLFYSLVILFGAVAPALSQDIDPASDPEIQPFARLPSGDYRLAWSDEFNGSHVDESKWNYRTGSKNEPEYVSCQQAGNNSVSGGLYRIHLRKESAGGKPYTAGGIISRKLFRYGYYESRMRIPKGEGWHTSFWMFRRTSSAALELDVIENDSGKPYTYLVNVHRWLPEPHEQFGTLYVDSTSPLTDFHVYGCEFTPETITYYFDNKRVQTINVSRLEHCDLNIWLTSLAALIHGTTAVDDSKLPAEAHFDYVRFFAPPQPAYYSETDIERRNLL